MKISRPFEYLIPEFRIQRNFIRNNFRIFLKIKFRWILGFNLIPVKRLLFFQNMTVLDESARFFHSLKTFQLISTDSENQSFFFQAKFFISGLLKKFHDVFEKMYRSDVANFRPLFYTKFTVHYFLNKMNKKRILVLVLKSVTGIMQKCLQILVQCMFPCIDIFPFVDTFSALNR